ncbi:CPBP family intramembrane glutamic endopeptidase [Dysgonomonas reticulitermitis]
MDNKGLLQGMGGWAQFFFLWFLFFTGIIFGSFILILGVDVKEMETSARVMRMSQMISQVFAFLIPALAFSFLCQGSSKTYLKLDIKTNLVLLALAIVLILVIQPLIDVIAYYNQQMSLPDSMKFIEEKMRDGELSAKKAVELLFSDKSVFGLIFNLLVIAIVAGLTEELFFRGCLQQIVLKISKNEHIAVWVTAIIFSVIHFQFFGFIPRVLLGAVLGYLFVWSRNLWVPVIVHTINNAAGVIFAYIYYGTSDYEQITDVSFETNIRFIIPSIILTSIFIVLIFKNRKRLEISK